MGFLDYFTKTAKPVAGRDTISRAVVGGNASGWASATGYTATSWDLDRALTHAYERVVWVFRCVHAISSRQANITIRLKDLTADQGQLISDPDFEKLLNVQANPFEDAWRFRYRLSSQLLLSPQGAFIEVIRSAAGQVVELYLLDPGSVSPVYSKTKWVEGYRVKRADGQETVLDPEKVIWLMNMPHPLDPYRNVTPLESAGVSIETDFFARLYNRNFLRNDGRPGMLVGIDADMTSEDAQELKALFAGGFVRAGETRVVDSKGLSIVDLTVRPRDAQWGEAIKNAKDNILDAFGVPESVIGNTAGRCLRASESVFLADGSIKRADELVGQTFELLQPSKGATRVVKAKADYALVEDIYRITTFSGRVLETNAEHPLFVSTSANQGPFKRDIFPHGWTAMKSIKAQFDRNDKHNVSKSDGGVFTEVAIPVHFPATNPVDQDPDHCFEIGEDGQKIPDFMFTADVESQRAFISGLYSRHGRLSQHTSFDIYPPSLDYARRLQLLLQRIGVHASVGTRKMRHMVAVSGKINMFNFLSQLDLEGDAAHRAKTVWTRLQTDTSREQNSFRSDGLPPGIIWDRVYNIEIIGKDQTVALTVPEGDHSYLSMFWEHNTFDNAESEVEGFYTGTVQDHCQAISRGLRGLTMDYGDNVVVQYMYEEIDVLQRAQRRREDKYKQEFLSGAITLDDLLIALGREPLNLPHSRVRYLPNNVIVGTPEDIQVVRDSQLNPQQLQGGFGSLNPFTAGTTGGDGRVGGTNDFAQQELANSGSPNAVQTVNDNAARTMRSARQNGTTPAAVNPRATVDIFERIDAMTGKSYVKQIDTKTDIHRDTRNRIQGFLEGTLDSWSDRQLAVASERLMHTKVRKGTRHWEGEPGTKVLDINYVVESGEWAKEIKSGVTDFLKPALIRAAYAEANRLKDSGYRAKGEFFNSASVDAIAVTVANDVTVAAQNQSGLLGKHIGVLDQDFKSLQEIQKTLEPATFDRQRWAVSLAQKATAYALEALYYYIYTNVEGKAFKIWHAGIDEQFRDGHAQLEGKMLPVNDKFDVNGEQLRFPTDTISNEGDNCSCWLYYGIDL
jgi:HK97 family phage portal protein